MTFANPYNACTTCGVRVYDYSPVTGNVPCGHRGFDRVVGSPGEWIQHEDAWKSVCPSWGPVDGCRCEPTCPLPTEMIVRVDPADTPAPR